MICLLLLSGQFVYSQLCTGSLGDPIVNISFGANSPGPLKPGVTNLTYYSLSCPNDGYYTITHSALGCFSNSWYDILSDHTGDPGGQFMLVNASVTPDDFYVDTVKGLCSNTTFEFAAWITNVLRASSCGFAGSKPNLTFRIETTSGQNLATYNTGDINSSGQIEWKQYGTFFKTPANVTAVVLRITNNAKGGCGNDLGLDDITFRPCGPVILSAAGNQASGTINICEGDTQSFTLNISTPAGFTGSVIQWQLSVDSGKTWADITGEQTDTYTRQPTAAGYYQYRAVVADAANFSSAFCRVASSVTTIKVNPVPVFVPKLFVLGCTSSDVFLQTVANNSYTYQWSGPNGFTANIANPVLAKVSYRDSGLYLAKVTTAENCTRTDSFLVKVFPGVRATATSDTAICEGTSILLQASGGTAYQWTPVSGLSDPSIPSPSASPTDTTNYRVTVTNQYGCSDTAHTKIIVYKNPVVNAGADKIIFEGQSVPLEGSITGNYTGFQWLPNKALSNSQALQPTANPADSITYILSVNPLYGCPSVSDAVFVFVYKNLDIPNAFSPNGDGINDNWEVKGLETYPASVTSIYARSGRMVFEQKGGRVSWNGSINGKPLPIGAYYYLINLNNGQPPVSGTVLIFR